jgi:hypothetical protein
MFDKPIPSLEAIGLKAARDVCKKLVEKLPDEEFAKKYFNIRGVQALGPNAPPLKQTICGTTWKLIRPDFDPRRDESPITSERELGPGDQILAAWSTHDVICPPDNRITVQGILHHWFILSSEEVQQKLGELMGLPASSIKKVNSVPEIQIESLDEKLEADAERFVQGLHDFFQDPKNHFEEITETLGDGAHGLIRAGNPANFLTTCLAWLPRCGDFRTINDPKLFAA